MFFVCLCSFKNDNRVFVGLTDNLNFQFELEKKYFEYLNLEVKNLEIVFFSDKKNLALEEKKIWLIKTKNINDDFNLESIPEKFITTDMKNKKLVKDELSKLESEYMQLFYKFETLKENYKNIDDIIEQSIHSSIEDWKDSILLNKEININSKIDSYYDVDGYDDCGYDRDGYDKDGYDLYGYDRNGYDDYGFNEEGIHRDDLNKDHIQVNLEFEKNQAKQKNNNKLNSKKTNNNINKIQTQKKENKIEKKQILKNGFLSYDEAKRFVKLLELKDQYDWERYSNNLITGLKEIPSYIPKDPKNVYLKEWISWDDWLGKKYNSFTNGDQIQKY